MLFKAAAAGIRMRSVANCNLRSVSAVKLLPNYWLVGRVWELKSTRGPNPPVPLARLRSIVLQQFIRNGTLASAPMPNTIENQKLDLHILLQQCTQIDESVDDSLKTTSFQFIPNP